MRSGYVNVALFQWLIRMSYRFISLKYTRLMSFCSAKISLCDVLSLSYSRNKEFAVHSSEAILDVITCNNTKSYEKVVGMRGSTPVFCISTSSRQSSRCKWNASAAMHLMRCIESWTTQHHTKSTVETTACNASSLTQVQELLNTTPTNAMEHNDLRVSLSTISVLSVPLLRQAIISTTCFVEEVVESECYGCLTRMRFYAKCGGTIESSNDDMICMLLLSAVMHKSTICISSINHIMFQILTSRTKNNFTSTPLRHHIVLLSEMT